MLDRLWRRRKDEDSVRDAEAAKERQRLVDALRAATSEVDSLKAALAIRTEEVGSLKREVKSATDYAADIGHLEGRMLTYRLKREQGEDYPAYKRRVLAIFREGRETPLFRAVLDLVEHESREAWRCWLDAKTPADAETHRVRAQASRDILHSLFMAAEMLDSIRGREAKVNEAMSYALQDMDDDRLAARTDRM